MVRCSCVLVVLAAAAVVMLVLPSPSEAQFFEVSGGSKVKVQVYFSTLCSDSMRFFRQQLQPAWTQLQDIMDLEFIPYGKARATPTQDGDYSFRCQHGDDECHGNRVMACAAAALPVATQMRLFHCMMSASYPAYAGPKCSEEEAVEWAPIEQCSLTRVGAKLLYENGLKTAALKPRLYFVPTTTIDGHYDHGQLRNSLQDLKTQICDAYQGQPHQNCL